MPCILVEPRIVRPPWGGPRLAIDWGKGEGSIGETWEAWPDGTIAGGGGLLASAVDFPLLVKLLDTREWLSVQVHPDAAAARSRVGAPRGKAEAWVVLHAEPGARIALGLSTSMSRDTLRARAASGDIESDLHWIYPLVGDVIDVPPGTIHAIGPGLLLYEIQEPIDLTWRLYDWGRGRELHLEHACAVANLTPCPTGYVRRDALRADGRVLATLLRTAQFRLDRVRAGAALDLDTAAALTVIDASLSLVEASVATPLSRGQTAVLSPGHYAVSGPGTALLAQP